MVLTKKYFVTLTKNVTYIHHRNQLVQWTSSGRDLCQWQ